MKPRDVRTVTVRIEATLADRARALAASQGVTLNAIFEQAIAGHIETQSIDLQSVAIPRQLPRGPRPRTRNSPRDLFVVLLDDEEGAVDIIDANDTLSNGAIGAA